LHCITAYPAPESQYNVRIIPLLRDLFGVAVGVSDHSQDPGLVPGLAVALGATTVEKHFTIDRHGSGLDDPIAMDPIMFTEMAATIRRVEGLLGDDPNAEALVIEQFKSEYGAQRVNAVLGTGRKALAAAESDNYATTRRSLIATRSVNAGEVLSDDAVAPLRAESLSPGLDPAILSVVRGARLTKALSSGEGLTWEHLLSRRRD
jgi:sialic acid synthase SpsE